MKKKFLIALSAISACAVLLASCGSGSPTEFSANWYKYTATPTVLPNTSETLVYSVALQADSASNSVYSVNYTNGTYTTELTAVSEEGESGLLYCYTTRLEIDVQYFYNGFPDENVFTDVVETKAVFRNTQPGQLRPLYSEKSVYSHSPYGPQPSETKYYELYDYSVRIDYDKEENSGVCVVTDRRETANAAEPSVKNFSFSDGYSYIDNESLLFSIRGMSLTSSHQVQCYNSSLNAVQGIKITPSSEETQNFEFEINGVKAARAISYYPTSVVAASSPSGATRTVWYASTTDSSNNLYRNVMLKLEDPVSYNLGTLEYTLVSASFTDA